MRNVWILLFMCGSAVGSAALDANWQGVPFQGHLAKAQKGHPEQYEILPDGEYNLTLSLYTSPTGLESRVWGPERFEKALVVNGTVNVMIRSASLLSQDPLFFDRLLYAGWTVDLDDQPETEEEELSPRQLLATPLHSTFSKHSFRSQQSEYALQADQAVHAQNALNAQIAEMAIVAQNGSPPGTIIAYAGMTVPVGWLPCDGQEVSREQYSKLFEAIGTAWGYGDQKQTFNVPDLRGFFLRGWAKGRLTDPDKDIRRSDRPGQSKGDSVGSVQDSAFEQHRHRFLIKTHYPFVPGGDFPALPQTNQKDENLFGNLDDKRVAEVMDASIGHTSQETRPLNVYVNYLIKY